MQFLCPKCRNKLRVPDGSTGKKCTCPCGETIIIPAPSLDNIAPPQRPMAPWPKPAPVEDFEEDEPEPEPRRERKRSIFDHGAWVGGGIAILIFCVGAATFLVGRHGAKEQEMPPVVVAPALPAPQPDDQPDQPGTAKPKAIAQSKWYEATIGDIIVTVLKVRIRHIPLIDFRTTSTSLEKHLEISLFVFNGSETKKLFHPGWSGDLFLAGPMSARLRDNFGNPHRHVTFGVGTRVVGQMKSESIFPGKGKDDVLVFDVPIDRMKSLELPAAAYGGDGVFRFEIPGDKVEGK